MAFGCKVAFTDLKSTFWDCWAKEKEKRNKKRYRIVVSQSFTNLGKDIEITFDGLLIALNK